MPTRAKHGEFTENEEKRAMKRSKGLFHSSFFAFWSGNSSKNSRYFLLFFAEIRTSDYGEYMGFEPEIAIRLNIISQKHTIKLGYLS